MAGISESDMNILREGAKKLCIPLTESQIEQFRLYYEELARWNTRFNLTAVSDRKGVQVRHFLDSLTVLLPLLAPLEARGMGRREACLRLWRRPLRAVDVGTGPGFPGLVLKLVWPALSLTLVESTGKKVRFLEHVVELLGLSGVEAMHIRAEELGHLPGHRESYDLVLARAVASLPTLAEYLLPLARQGGVVLAMKGPTATEEAMAAEEAIRILGGKIRKLWEVEVPSLAEERRIVVIDKVVPTPELYPRRPGVPQKHPLGKGQSR